MYTNNKQQLKDDIATIRDPPIWSEQWQNSDYCKCGKWKEMPTDIENKCCKQKRCLSRTNVFVNMCIDKEIYPIPMYLHQDTQISQCDTQHIVSMWCENTAMLEQGVEWLSHHVVYAQYECLPVTSKPVHWLLKRWWTRYMWLIEWPVC